MDLHRPPQTDRFGDICSRTTLKPIDRRFDVGMTARTESGSPRVVSAAISGRLQPAPTVRPRQSFVCDTANWSGQKGNCGTGYRLQILRYVANSYYTAVTAPFAGRDVFPSIRKGHRVPNRQQSHGPLPAAWSGLDLWWEAGEEESSEGRRRRPQMAVVCLREANGEREEDVIFR